MPFEDLVAIAYFIGFLEFTKFLVSGTTTSLHERNATPKDGMSRTASGSDINEKHYSLFFPLERLAKVNAI